MQNSSEVRVLGKWIRLFFLSVTLLVSCHDPASTPPLANTVIDGRHVPSLYHIYVPANWQVYYPQSSDYQIDTRLPLVEIAYASIKIAIHNFPGIEIPPQAQVERWQKQLKDLAASSIEIMPTAWSGYEGLKLTSPQVMAWAMQLAIEHERVLWQEVDPQKERGASFTIKVTGLAEDLAKEQETIEAIALSFEPIEPFQGH